MERSLLEEEKLAESVQRRGKRSRPGQTEIMSSITRNLPEPELPPTPAQLGLEPRSQPPAGVLSSSPKTTAQGRKTILKSSPLKRKSISKSDAARSEAQQSEAPYQPSAEIPLVTPKTIADDQEDIEEDDDPEILERRKRLDQLGKQLTTLWSDVGFLHSQIRRYQERPDQNINPSNLTRLV